MADSGRGVDAYDDAVPVRDGPPATGDDRHGAQHHASLAQAAHLDASDAAAGGGRLGDVVNDACEDV
jgi:hypothetical protein